MKNYITVKYRISGRTHITFNKTFEGVYIRIHTVYTKYELERLHQHVIIKQTPNYIIVEFEAHFTLDTMIAIANLMTSSAYSKMAAGADIIGEPDFKCE